MNPHTWTKVGANRSSCLTASPYCWMFGLLNPPPPSAPPPVSRGAICLAYNLSQMNLHMCAKFGANRSSRLTASTDFWICDPLKPPKCSPGYWGRIVFSLCPFPVESAEVYHIWCQSVQQFDSFLRLLNLWPPKTPWGIEGPIVFSLWRFPDESADLNHIWCQSLHRLTASPNIWIFDPLKPPAVWQLPKTFACLTPTNPKCPLCLEGQFVWRISIPTWICRCVPNLGPIGPAVWQLPKTFEFVTPYPYPPPRNATWGIDGRLVFSLCPFPDESADVNQSGCQSDSFPILFNCWPPKTLQVHPLCLEGQFVWRMSIPIWICTCVPNLVPIGPAVW